MKILVAALSMVAAQSNNPGVDVSGSAAQMQADYEKMPVERQRRFWVSKTRLLLHCELVCVVKMVVDSILPHVESEPNDHQKEAPSFTLVYEWSGIFQSKTARCL